MDYVKDEFGNIIGYKGDDLSQQQAKLSGIPQGQAEKPVNNIFAGLSNQQERNMTYTSDDLQRGYKAVVPNQQAQQSVNSPSGHENVGHGNEASAPNAAKMDVTRDHQGNYYTNGVKTPMTVFNPNAVPYRDTQSRPQITNMDELASAMGYTSPEEEARLRKASVNNQRILAVADALRHIGNIANTVNYAPAQRFNQPWAEEQLRYEHGKAQRDRANNVLLTYQQQKARQDALQRQWEAEQQYKRDKAAADAENTRLYHEGLLKNKEAETARKKENDDRNYELRKGTDAWRREQGQQRINLSASKKGGTSGGRRRVTRRSDGNGGFEYEFWDKNGVHHTSKTVTGIEAKLQEYAPEISATEIYDKKDSSGNSVKASRKASVGNRIGNANSKYRPGKGKKKVNW